MSEVTHIRRDHLIFTVDGVLVKDCKSINAAKLESRLQQKPGVKDRWVVKVEHVKKPGPKVKDRSKPQRVVQNRQQDKPRLLGMSQAEVRRLQANTDD